MGVGVGLMPTPRPALAAADALRSQKSNWTLTFANRAETSDAGCRYVAGVAVLSVWKYA